MVSALVDLLIFIAGMVVMGFLMLPDVMNSWEEGCLEAKKTYDDWDKGFEQGFYSGAEYAFKHIEETCYGKRKEDELDKLR